MTISFFLTSRGRLMMKYLQVATLLSAGTLARAQELDRRSSTEALGTTFSAFLNSVESETDSVRKNLTVDNFIGKLRQYGRPVIEDSTIYFLYQGPVRRVSVPGDLNGWNPRADTMLRVSKTNLFYLAKTIDPRARFEYKLAVDSTWIKDPLNRQEVMGGYGANSEIWMPHYQPPEEISYRSDIQHGTLDSLKLKSKTLGRTHPVFVYLPPGYKNRARTPYPTIYVTDGGEYISLALMLNVLDNLIAEKRIKPVVAVFVDPRTNIRDAATSKRMLDYTLSDSFVTFMTDEVRAKILGRYNVDKRAGQTAIMGASLGGLISTYAAFKRPDVFGLAAAQSPSYWWKNDTLISMISATPKKNVKFYIDTGTIRDAQATSFEMKNMMESKGYEVHYEEHPEAHNWANWRAHLSHILEYFWAAK